MRHCVATTQVAMPRAKNAKIWNDDLVAACDSRRAQAAANQSRVEFQWITAKQKIEATNKEIYITSTDSVKNLPAGLSKTVEDTLHRIIRGKEAVTLGGAAPAPAAGGAAPAPAAPAAAARP